MRRSAAMAGICCVGLAAACSSGGEVQRQGETVLMVGPADEGMDALFEGTVARTPSGCLGMSSGGGAGEVLPAAWPAGTTLIDDGNAIELDGESYPLGATVRAGGGEVESLPFDPPAECVSDTYSYQFWELEPAG